MKSLHVIYFLISITAFSQKPIKTSFIEKTELKANTFISTNNFESTFYIQNNAFVLKKKFRAISYSNIQLGNITSANTYNPLKINLFYKDFNTAIILDNRLAEIFKIDFNIMQPYKNITHISTGFDNSLWLFNQDTQQLELYDYKTNTTRVQTLPIQSSILDLKSNYNYCWLLTKNYLYTYNYFGSLISKIKNIGYTSLTEANGNIVLKKGNRLSYLKKGNQNIVPIEIPKLLINQFSLTNGSLYIYNNEFLYKYQLIKD